MAITFGFDSFSTVYLHLGCLLPPGLLTSTRPAYFHLACLLPSGLLTSIWPARLQFCPVKRSVLLETKDTRFAVQEAHYFLAVILKRAVIRIPGNFAGKVCVFKLSSFNNF